MRESLRKERHIYKREKILWRIANESVRLKITWLLQRRYYGNRMKSNQRAERARDSKQDQHCLRRTNNVHNSTLYNVRTTFFLYFLFSNSVSSALALQYNKLFNFAFIYKINETLRDKKKIFRCKWISVNIDIND